VGFFLGSFETNTLKEMLAVPSNKDVKLPFPQLTARL